MLAGRMPISRLELTDFTVFKTAQFTFSPGINVLIGENGTGKSHVLKALYATTSERRLREHVIFVLSQRNEEAATNTLIEIARTDPDREMKKKALFWLAQEDDPRVTKLITDMVVK